MKQKKLIVRLLSLMYLFVFVQSAFAIRGADILYNESELRGGYWKYDYTFLNTSSTESLYSVRLEFDRLYGVSNSEMGGSWEGMWGNLSQTIFMETHSGNSAFHIEAGSSLSEFSFTTDSQIGNTAYTAFFDDHNGNRLFTTGNTASHTFSNATEAPMAPEPVSSVLFLVGGAAMAFRNRKKRKKPLSQ